MPQHSQNVVAGVLFFILGAIFLIAGWSYPAGSLSRMGPGMFPFIVSLALMVCSVGLILSNLAHFNRKDFANLDPRHIWRPVLVVTIAILTFGLTIERFGIVVSITALFLISCLAGEKRSVLAGLLGAGLLAAAITVIFVYVLNIPMKVFP